MTEIMVVTAALAIVHQTRLELHDPAIRHEEHGLCRLMYTIKTHLENEIGYDHRELRLATHLIDEIWKKWPGYSGTSMYPIKAPWWFLGSEVAYYKAGKNFVGHRLKRRRELMDFTHEELKDLLIRNCYE